MDIYLSLVNADNKFEKSMIADFKMKKIKDLDGDTYLEEETLKAFRLLAKHMAKKHKIALSINSGLRNEQQQRDTMEFFIKKEGEKAAKERVAEPGHTEHHLGTALDVGVHRLHAPMEESLYKHPLTTKVMNKVLPTSKEDEKKMYKILHSELAQFGFILRYPRDKKEITKIKRDEDWHIRFVGVENAKEMLAAQMCLEEYVEHLKTQEDEVSVD